MIDDHPTVVVVTGALNQAKDMAAAAQDNHSKNKSSQSMVSLNSKLKGVLRNLR